MIELLDAIKNEMNYLESGDGSNDCCRKCVKSDDKNSNMVCTYNNLCRFFVNSNAVCNFYKLDPFRAIEDWAVREDWSITKPNEIYRFKMGYMYLFPSEEEPDIKIITREKPDSFWDLYTFFYISGQEIIISNKGWNGMYLYREGMDSAQVVFSYVLNSLMSISNREKEIQKMYGPLFIPNKKKERIFLGS